MIETGTVTRLEAAPAGPAGTQLAHVEIPRIGRGFTVGPCSVVGGGATLATGDRVALVALAGIEGEFVVIGALPA